MKIFGRMIFGFFIVLIGFNLFSCSRSSAYNQAVKEGVDLAYVDGDYEIVNQMYEYAYKTPFINKESITIVDGDNRLEEVENRDINFDLYVFLQVREENPTFGAKLRTPVFTVLVTDLSLKNRAQTLDIVIYKYNKVDDKEETTVVEYQLVGAGEKNWYIQTFEFDTTEIKKILITHAGPSTKEPIILYDSGYDPFLKESDHTILNVLKDDLSLEANNVIKVEQKAFKPSWTMTIITMVIYVAAAGLVAYVMFFKKNKQAPIVQQKVDNNTASRANDRKIVETPKENINIKNIEETKQRDDIETKKDK